MKLLKKKFAKVSLLLVLLGSFGIGPVAHALPFTKELVLDFDMELPDGTPYNDAKVLVDVEYERTYPDFINKFLTPVSQDILVTPNNGNYYHSSGSINLRAYFTIPPAMTKSMAYVYYTNLRIESAYIKSLELGDVKTYHSTGERYSETDWEKIIATENKDYPLTNANDKFTVLANGTYVWKEGNFLTGDHIRPSVEIASLQMGGGMGTRGAYHLTSTNNSGEKLYLVATPYQVKENYVDASGTVITPPVGFTQGKQINANANQYTHTLTGLPTSYTTGGNNYVLKGSYKGPTRPSTLNQSYPPSITVDYTDSGVPDFDKEGQITVVYSLAVKLNEKYVDESGAQIDASWDPSTPLDVEDGEAFTIPHSIGDTKVDSSNNSWEYVGWKYNTDPAGTKRTTTTTPPINGDTTIEYIYKLSKTTATLDLTPTPKIVNNNSNVSWTSRLTNTGNAPLKDLILKSTSNWSTSLKDPVQVTVTPAGGGPAQNFPVNPGDWSTGVNLTGITIPNGGVNNYADITFTTVTTANNAVNQVLPAEIEVAGNIPTPVTAENFVRIDDPDEPNLEPVGNAGLINIPNFKFGEVEVKPFAQTKKLDTTAYQSGYHPYIRFMDMESTGGWSLTAKLDQFKSGTKTLPTTTTIKLKNGVLMEVQNYDKHNETLNYVDLAGSVSIPSDNNSVAFTNGTNQGVYQLEYDSNGVELELMAHSGIAGLSYQADMEWTLTTAP